MQVWILFGDIRIYFLKENYRKLYISENTLSIMDLETIPQDFDVPSISPEEVKLPYIIKDKVLLGPGVWNENYYDSNSIKKAFEDTDWSNKENRHLFWDHEDKITKEWVGFLENPRFDNGKLMGDLAFWDKDAAVKVGIAGMKCGISAKVHGMEDSETKAMSDYTFENFSLVLNPACKISYINLTERAKKGDKEAMKELEKINKINIQSSSKKAIAKLEEDIYNYKGGKNLSKMAEEELKKEEVKVEEKPVEKPEAPEAPKEEAKESSEAPSEEAKEMSDAEVSDILSSMTTNDLTALTKLKNSHADWTFKKVLSEFKEQKAITDKFSELSEKEILEKINELTAMLKRKQTLSPEMNAKREMEDTIKKMSSKIDDLNNKLNEPDKKSVKTLGAVNKPTLAKNVDATESMMDFMRSNLGKGGRLF